MHYFATSVFMFQKHMMTKLSCMVCFEKKIDLVSPPSQIKQDIIFCIMMTIRITLVSCDPFCYALRLR